MTDYNYEPGEEEAEIPMSESYVPPDDLTIEKADDEDLESISGIEGDLDEDEELEGEEETEEEEYYRLQEQRELDEHAEELARERMEAQLRESSSKPNEASFETYDDYIEALTDWKVKQEIGKAGLSPGASLEQIQAYRESLSDEDLELFDKRQGILATLDECKLGAEIAADMGRGDEAVDWLNRLPLWAKDLEDLPELEAEKFGRKSQEAVISNAIVELASLGNLSPSQRNQLRDLIRHHNNSNDPALPLLATDRKSGELKVLKLADDESPRDALVTAKSHNYPGTESEQILAYAPNTSWTLSTLADYMNRLKFDSNEAYRAERLEREREKAEGKKPKTKNPSKMSMPEYKQWREGDKPQPLPRMGIGVGDKLVAKVPKE